MQILRWYPCPHNNLINGDRGYKVGFPLFSMIFAVTRVQSISTVDTRYPTYVQLPYATTDFREGKDVASIHFKKTEDWEVSHHISVWTLPSLNFWIKDAFLQHEKLSNALRMFLEHNLDVKQTLSCLVSPGPRHFWANSRNPVTLYISKLDPSNTSQISRTERRVSKVKYFPFCAKNGNRY